MRVFWVVLLQPQSSVGVFVMGTSSGFLPQGALAMVIPSPGRDLPVETRSALGVQRLSLELLVHWALRRIWAD